MRWLTAVVFSDIFIQSIANQPNSQTTPSERPTTPSIVISGEPYLHALKCRDVPRSHPQKNPSSGPCYGIGHSSLFSLNTGLRPSMRYQLKITSGISFSSNLPLHRQNRYKTRIGTDRHGCCISSEHWRELSQQDR